MLTMFNIHIYIVLLETTIGPLLLFRNNKKNIENLSVVCSVACYLVPRFIVLY